MVKVLECKANPKEIELKEGKGPQSANSELLPKHLNKYV